MNVTASLHGLNATSVAGDIMHSADLKALNTFENPNEVNSEEFTNVSLTSNGLTTELPAASLVRLNLEIPG